MLGAVRAEQHGPRVDRPDRRRRTGTRAGTVRQLERRPARPTQPHLSDMTTKAIRLLDKQTRDQPKGFFLQVEGASIDKQDHAANPCGQIGETVEFDEAVKVALRLPARATPTRSSSSPPTTVTPARSSRPAPPRPASTATLTHPRRRRHDDQLRAPTAVPRLAAAHRHPGADRRRAARRPPTSSGVTDQTDLFFTMAARARPVLATRAGAPPRTTVRAARPVVRAPDSPCRSAIADSHSSSARSTGPRG